MKIDQNINQNYFMQYYWIYKKFYFNFENLNNFWYYSFTRLHKSYDKIIILIKLSTINLLSYEHQKCLKTVKDF